MAGCIRNLLAMYISLCSVLTFSGSSLTNITDRHSSEDDYIHKNFIKHSYIHESRKHQARLIQVTNKNSKIRLELSFAVPFVEIPVPGSGKYSAYASGQAKEPLVDVNLGALVSAGIMATAALIFIPKVFGGIGPQVNIGRNVDDRSGVSKVLSQIDEKLLTHDIDSTICTQRAVCWLVKGAAAKVLQGRAGSVDKIIDGITSNSWLQGFVNGTAIQEAMTIGRRNENCNLVYQKCHINESRLQSVFKYFLTDD